MTEKFFYDNNTCNQFVRDMENAGFTVEHYRGRFFWEGPAVRTTDDYDEDDIVRATEVPLQRDDMGRGAIRYPRRGGKRIEPADASGELAKIDTALGVAEERPLGKSQGARAERKAAMRREMYGEPEIDTRTEADLREEGFQRDIYEDFQGLRDDKE